MEDNLENFVIIFGPEIWSLQENGGVSRYCYELITNLESIGVSIRVLLGPNSNVYSKLLNPNLIVNLKDDSKSEIIRGISEGMTKFDRGIYHGTYYRTRNFKIAAKQGLKTVVTVHDLIGELFPTKIKRYKRRNRDQEKTVKFCDFIVSVSQNTKKDIVETYGVDEAKIQVIYLGVSNLGNGKSSIDLPTNPYVLHVGKRDGYKNFMLTVQSISQSERLSSLNIIAFGGGAFSETEIFRFSELNMKTRVKHVSGGDQVLKYFYTNAVALVYPSLYEGFGIPPLEAMRSRCPVIVANGGSIPEVCGNLAYYFDPTSMDSLVCKLIEFVENTSKYPLEDAYNHSLLFNWESTSSTTLKIYQELCGCIK